MRLAAGFGLLALLCSAARAAAAKTIIIDTDAGPDDLMAIAFLLERPEIQIEAINVVHGVAHVPRGMDNIRKLLALAGRERIPVYPGAEKAIGAGVEFPAPWRADADKLLDGFPVSSTPPPSGDALSYYRKRPRHDATILALGPLTNLALAIENGVVFREIVIMGGALDVPGNLGDGGFFKTANTKSEWNLFCDPQADAVVFRSSARLRLVPLDATNRVPLNLGFLDELRRNAASPLAKAVVRLLDRERELLAKGILFAWDPLAAVSIAQPEVLRQIPLKLTIDAEGAIRRDEALGRPVDIALRADAALFRKLYLETVR